MCVGGVKSCVCCDVVGVVGVGDCDGDVYVDLEGDVGIRRF